MCATEEYFLYLELEAEVPPLNRLQYGRCVSENLELFLHFLENLHLDHHRKQALIQDQESGNAVLSHHVPILKFLSFRLEKHLSKLAVIRDEHVGNVIVAYHGDLLLVFYPCHLGKDHRKLVTVCSVDGQTTTLLDF